MKVYLIWITNFININLPPPQKKSKSNDSSLLNSASHFFTMIVLLILNHKFSKIRKTFKVLLRSLSIYRSRNLKKRHQKKRLKQDFISQQQDYKTKVVNSFLSIVKKSHW